MAEVCLRVEALLCIKMCMIWPRCASVWRPDCISKYYDMVEVCLSVEAWLCIKMCTIWPRCAQCGGLIVYQNVYDMAKMCLSVKAWLYIKVCTIPLRCASVWRPDCISKYVKYGWGVPLCGGRIVYQSMYNMTEVSLCVEVWLNIKVCPIWLRFASVWRPDCISKYVQNGWGVPQCWSLMDYQSIFNTAQVFFCIKAWLYIKVCMIWRRHALVWRPVYISK